MKYSTAFVMVKEDGFATHDCILLHGIYPANSEDEARGLALKEARRHAPDHRILFSNVLPVDKPLTEEELQEVVDRLPKLVKA